MTSLGLVLVVTAFLSGAASAVFIMVVVGIRQGDRPWHLHDVRSTAAGADTRTMLDTGTWPNVPVAFDNREER